MQQIDEPERYPETKIIALTQDYNLSTWSCPTGWLLLGMWTESFDDTIWQNNVTIPIRKSRTLVLIGRSEETALAEANGRIADLEKAKADLAKQAKAQEESMLQVCRVRDEMSENCKRYRGLYDSQVTERAAEKERFQAMERDMGKLREVLGRKQIDDILSK